MAKPRALLRLAAGLAAFAAVAWWLFPRRTGPASPSPETVSPVRSETAPSVAESTGAERLLDGYADPATAPVEDLRKLHRVTVGYFSIIKDASRFPIGGNEDLAAALRGENPDREIFVRADHPLFLVDGRIGDRWGNPLVVHPVGWKQLELRSAGPDGIPHNDDDLLLDPQGHPAD